MAFTLELLTSLIVAVVASVALCNAESLPPPTNLSHTWIDAFTVNVSWSWKKPSDLPGDCDIKFKYSLGGQDVKLTGDNYFVENCLTEEIMSSDCNYSIHTTSSPACNGWTDSKPLTSAVHTQKRRGEVVKDFKCLPDDRGMNCSWILVNRSHKLTLTYRMCGRSEKVLKEEHFKNCSKNYTTGARDGCYLSDGNVDTCIHAATEAEAMTFKPVLALHSPKLTVKKNEKNLDLTWEPPEVGAGCVWKCELCFTKCGEEKKMCLNVTREGCVNKTREECEIKKQMPYDENCQYAFESRVITEKYCPQISSDFSDVVFFGINKPDRLLTVVGIIVPFVLSVCVVLAFYCVRKHYHIIFPTIPDPRALLKGMMNGNNNLKPPPANVYIPQTEHTESCKLVKEPIDTEQLL